MLVLICEFEKVLLFNSSKTFVQLIQAFRKCKYYAPQSLQIAEPVICEQLRIWFQSRNPLKSYCELVQEFNIDFTGNIQYQKMTRIMICELDWYHMLHTAQTGTQLELTGERKGRGLKGRVFNKRRHNSGNVCGTLGRKVLELMN